MEYFGLRPDTTTERYANLNIYKVIRCPLCVTFLAHKEFCCFPVSRHFPYSFGALCVTFLAHKGFCCFPISRQFSVFVRCPLCVTVLAHKVDIWCPCVSRFWLTKDFVVFLFLDTFRIRSVPPVSNGFGSNKGICQNKKRITK